MRPWFQSLSLMAIAAHPLGAQASWDASIGLERYEQADALASPLRYRGTSPSLGLAWRHRDRTLSGVSVRVAQARLTTHLSLRGTHHMDAWDGRLEGHWLRRVADGRGSTLHVGARINVFASVRQQTFRPDVSTELYGDMIAGLEAAVAWTLLPAVGHSLRQEISLPFASAVLRTPYAGAKYMPPLVWGGPGRLVGLRYEVEYSRAVAGRIALGGRYTFNAFHYPDPRSLSVVSHRLSAVVRVGSGAR